MRAIAAELGLAVAAKPDSQDICFVPDGDYARLVKAVRPDTDGPGDIVTLDGPAARRPSRDRPFHRRPAPGDRLGGQKEPFYVVRIEPEERRVVVGPRRALAVAEMRVEDWNWLGEDQRDVSVKVRSLAPAVAARRDGEAIRFSAPEYGVSPGQAAVAYAGTRLLGGGVIAETIAATKRLRPEAKAGNCRR